MLPNKVLLEVASHHWVSADGTFHRRADAPGGVRVQLGPRPSLCAPLCGAFLDYSPCHLQQQPAGSVRHCGGAVLIGAAKKTEVAGNVL